MAAKKICKKRDALVCYTAVFSVVTQSSTPQGALRDDPKKRLYSRLVMHGQSCCFVNKNLLLFCRSRCRCRYRRRRRCLNSLLPVNDHKITASCLTNVSKALNQTLKTAKRNF